MRILLIGNGGREHAIARSLAKGSSSDILYAIPGNPGIGQYCECIAISSQDFKSICNFVVNSKIQLVIIGPEVPICDGLTDYLLELGIKVFAPNQKASLLESSKKFTKEIALENNIPTASARWFNQYHDSVEYLKELDPPYVIKADGLAAGKGVAICESYIDAENSIKDIFNGRFGDGQSILIEEFLNGEEVSYFAISDGKNILPLIGAKDHKRLLDGDNGPNTGGMGAYCPPPILSKELENKIINQILEPTLYGLNKRGISYKGVLFAGLMIKDEEPSLIEYNIRFGDPETQALLMLLKSNFTELVLDTVNGNLRNHKIEWHEKKALTVVLANKGYPLEYNMNSEITGVEDAEKNPNIKVFHAGTSLKEGQLIATGGRVMNVTSTADTIKEAREDAYKAIDKIKYENKFYRKDIAWSEL
jgi:phosphoribosylamine---glycine ligase